MIWYGMWTKDAAVGHEELPWALLEEEGAPCYEHEVRLQRPQRMAKAMDPVIDDMIALVATVNASWFNFLSFMLIAMVPAIPLSLIISPSLYYMALYAGVCEGILGLSMATAMPAFFAALIQGMAEDAAHAMLSAGPLKALAQWGIDWALVVDGMNNLLISKTWPRGDFEKMWIVRQAKLGAKGFQPALDISDWVEKVFKNGRPFKPSEIAKPHPLFVRMARWPWHTLCDILRLVDVDPSRDQGSCDFNRGGFDILPESGKAPIDLLAEAVHRFANKRPQQDAFMDYYTWPRMFLLGKSFDDANLSGTHKFVGDCINSVLVWGKGIPALPFVGMGWRCRKCRATFRGKKYTVYRAGNVNIDIKIVGKEKKGQKYGKKLLEKKISWPLCAHLEIFCFDEGWDVKMKRKVTGGAKTQLLTWEGLKVLKNVGAHRVHIELKMKKDENVSGLLQGYPGFQFPKIELGFYDALGKYDYVDVGEIFRDLVYKLGSEGKLDQFKVLGVYVKIDVEAIGPNNEFGTDWLRRDFSPMCAPNCKNAFQAAKAEFEKHLRKYLKKLVAVHLILAGLTVVIALAPFSAALGGMGLLPTQVWKPPFGLHRIVEPTIETLILWQQAYLGPLVLVFGNEAFNEPVIPGPTSILALSAGAPKEKYAVFDPWSKARSVTLADIMVYWFEDIANLAQSLGYSRGVALQAIAQAAREVGVRIPLHKPLMIAIPIPAGRNWEWASENPTVDYLRPVFPSSGHKSIIYFENLRAILQAAAQTYFDMFRVVTHEVPLEFIKDRDWVPRGCWFDGKTIIWRGSLYCNKASFLLLACYLTLKMLDKALWDIMDLLQLMSVYLTKRLTALRIKPTSMLDYVAGASRPPIEELFRMHAQEFTTTLSLNMRLARAWATGKGWICGETLFPEEMAPP